MEVVVVTGTYPIGGSALADRLWSGEGRVVEDRDMDNRR